MFIKSIKCSLKVSNNHEKLLNVHEKVSTITLSFYFFFFKNCLNKIKIDKNKCPKSKCVNETWKNNVKIITHCMMVSMNFLDIIFDCINFVDFFIFLSLIFFNVH
jgi:hypothetical protein